MGKMKKLKVLLNQQDTARSKRIMVYYEYLNRERLEKLELTRQILQDLGQLEDEERLASQKLSQLVEQKQTERTKLTNVRETRTVLLAELKKEQHSKAGELAKLKQREAELRRLIASLQVASDEVADAGAGSGKPFFQQKGLLKWPVNGRLSKKFGNQRGGGQWDGVLIDTKEGTEVRAVAKGRIVYSDWLRGYGFLVIIDHGKSYMSLYAFNQSLYKKEGGRVSQGDIIASVGKSGGRIQAGLYFGIRKNGKPLNPVKWCRKIHQGKIR
jgi:septal ring factor EnvC (AmiA/AmiB activator)